MFSWGPYFSDLWKKGGKGLGPGLEPGQQISGAKHWPRGEKQPNNPQGFSYSFDARQTFSFLSPDFWAGALQALPHLGAEWGPRLGSKLRLNPVSFRACILQQGR